MFLSWWLQWWYQAIILSLDGTHLRLYLSRSSPPVKCVGVLLSYCSSLVNSTVSNHFTWCAFNCQMRHRSVIFSSILNNIFQYTSWRSLMPLLSSAFCIQIRGMLLLYRWVTLDLRTHLIVLMLNRLAHVSDRILHSTAKLFMQTMNTGTRVFGQSSCCIGRTRAAYATIFTQYCLQLSDHLVSLKTWQGLWLLFC